jgi:Flp pilus assembly protein TadB
MERHDLWLLASSGLAGLATILAVGRVLPAWDYLARKRVADLMPMIRALSLPEAWVSWGLRFWGVALVAAVLGLGFVLDMYVLVGPALYLIYSSPRWIFRHLIATRKRLLRDQLVSVSASLANSARSGQALPQGLEEVSSDAPRPIKAELLRIVHDYKRGRTIRDAISDTQKRLQLDTFNLFANVILSCRESGAKYTEALDGLSHSLMENQRLERKLDSETAGGQTLIWVLGLFPVGFLAMFYVLDPVGTGLVLETAPGHCVLVAVGVLIYFSVIMAKRILRIEY